MNRTEDTLTEDERRGRAEAWRLIEGAGALREAGRLHETEEPLRRALALLEAVWGGDHPETAAALYHVAGLCHAQERYAEAQALYARAARIHRDAFGPDDPRAADDLYWLGGSFFSDQKYDESERAYTEALATLERAHGPHDPRLADCLLALGHLRYFVGRYAEAEEPELRGLALRERGHGPDHPLVAQALMQVANLYHHGRGVGGDAEPFYRRAVTIVERTHAGGKYHAECVYRLALFLSDGGRAEEAAPLYARAIELLDAAPDAEGWDTFWMSGGYADFLRAAGRGPEAEAFEARQPRSTHEEVLREKVKQREVTYGPDHPETAEALYGLANALRYEGDDEEAAALYERARAIWEEARALSPAAACLNRLSAISRGRGRLDEAAAYLDRADLLLGDDAEGAAQERGRALEQRALLEQARGRHDAGEALYLRAVAIYESCLEQESYAFVEALYRLAIFYGDAGRYADSEAVLLRLIPLAERSAELDDLETSDFHRYHARVLRAQGREEGAARADARAAESGAREEEPE